MNKKLLIAALTMAVTLSLTACGNKPKTYTEKDLETMSAEQAESILNEKITATEAAPNAKGKEVLDIWSDVVLIGEGHEGRDPNAEFRIEYTGDNQFIKDNITYSWENIFDMQKKTLCYNGKKVKCSAECDEELLKKNNYIIEAKSHTLVIEGLDERLTELKDEFDYTAQDKKITEAFIKEINSETSLFKNFKVGVKFRLYNTKFMQLYVRTPDSTDGYSEITIDEIKDIYPIKRTLIFNDFGTFSQSEVHYELDFVADIIAHYDDGTIFDGTVWIGNADDMSAYVNKDNTIGSEFDNENYIGKFGYDGDILIYRDDLLDGYIEGYKATIPMAKITSQNIK